MAEKKKRIARSKKKKKNYIEKEELAEELRKFQKSIGSDGIGQPSEFLGKMLKDIADNYANQPCWSNYSMIEDMKGDAILRMMQYLPKMKPDNNPLSYCTCICFSSFMANIRAVKKADLVKRNLALEYLSDMGQADSIYTEKQKRILDEISKALE